MEWQPIETAPEVGRVDIWAKRWIAKTDEFEYRRFTDCFWRSTHFAKVPKDWRPTHWLLVPESPQQDIKNSVEVSNERIARRSRGDTLLGTTSEALQESGG